MIGYPTRHRRGSDADFDLPAFNLANSILFCAGLAETIKHQGFTIPGTERINRQAFVFNKFM